MGGPSKDSLAELGLLSGPIFLATHLKYLRPGQPATRGAIYSCDPRGHFEQAGISVGVDVNLPACFFFALFDDTYSVWVPSMLGISTSLQGLAYHGCNVRTISLALFLHYSPLQAAQAC